MQRYVKESVFQLLQVMNKIHRLNCVKLSDVSQRRNDKNGYCDNLCIVDNIEEYSESRANELA